MGKCSAAEFRAESEAANAPVGDITCWQSVNTRASGCMGTAHVIEQGHSATAAERTNTSP